MGVLQYKLKDIGYIHHTVIHEQEFVNKEGFHTYLIESLWSQLKICGLLACMTYRTELFDRYLISFATRVT